MWFSLVVSLTAQCISLWLGRWWYWSRCWSKGYFIELWWLFGHGMHVRLLIPYQLCLHLEKILVLLSACYRRKKEGFGYPGSWSLVCFSVAVRLQTLQVKIPFVPIFFCFKRKKNRLVMTLLGFLTFDCPSMADSTSSMQYGMLNVSASSSTGKPGPHRDIPPCWLWWMVHFGGYLGSLLKYLAVGC